MIASVLCAYLIGSVPFALLTARQWGARDLRSTGSGNLGAANVLRVSGPIAGILVALLDIGKGAASVLLAEHLNDSHGASAIAGLAAIMGQIYPVWLRFRSGKGVATACGVFSVLAPSATLMAAIVFVGGVWLTRFVSVGSVLASATLPTAALALGQQTSVVVSATAAALLITFRHRSNLERLRLGAERRIGVRS